MKHQGNFIRAHLKERRYHLDELSDDALIKTAWVWAMTPEQFFALPGDGRPFG